MHLVINRKEHLKDFIALNEAWIKRYFALEDADQVLANRPEKIIEDGGFILAIIENNQVIGVCALFKESEKIYQLARMAVRDGFLGKGYGQALMKAALEQLENIQAERVYLLSNTRLVPAINLYKKFGFQTTKLGQHPIYARADIIMEKVLVTVSSDN